MSEHEKVVAELREWFRAPDWAENFTQSDLLKWIKARPTVKFEQMASRLEEVTAEKERIQAAALVHIDEMTAFQRTMVIMERERDVAKAALTAAEAEKERLLRALDLALDSDRQSDIREAITIRAAALSPKKEQDQ